MPESFQGYEDSYDGRSDELRAIINRNGGYVARVLEGLGEDGESQTGERLGRLHRFYPDGLEFDLDG